MRASSRPNALTIKARVYSRRSVTAMANDVRDHIVA